MAIRTSLQFVYAKQKKPPSARLRVRELLLQIQGWVETQFYNVQSQPAWWRFGFRLLAELPKFIKTEYTGDSLAWYHESHTTTILNWDKYRQDRYDNCYHVMVEKVQLHLMGCNHVTQHSGCCKALPNLFWCFNAGYDILRVSCIMHTERIWFDMAKKLGINESFMPNSHIGNECNTAWRNKNGKIDVA